MDGLINLILSAQNGVLIIECSDKSKFSFLKKLGAEKKIFNKNKWKLNYNSKADLSKLFTHLRDEKFIFMGGSNGWQPSDIFQNLRNEGFVKGDAMEIVWLNKKTSEMRKI